MTDNTKYSIALNENTHKLAVTIWNYKCGVGKSAISLVLAEIAAQQGLRVLALDLDEQQNLAHTLTLADSLFPNINVRSVLAHEFADENFDFFILDTHPSKDNTILEALKFADIVLIPILGDYHSIINLRSVFNYVTAAGVGQGQIAIVKNSMTSLKMSAEVELVLDEQGYPSAVKLPRSNILIRNIASGYRWDKSMQLRQREPFLHLYSNIWSAFEEMCSGNFYNLWRD